MDRGAWRTIVQRVPKSQTRLTLSLCFPCGSACKESAYNAGDLGSIPQLGRSPGEGKGYPLQYSGLENSMGCVVHGISKSWTWLSDFHFQAEIARDQQGCIVDQRIWLSNSWEVVLRSLLGSSCKSLSPYKSNCKPLLENNSFSFFTCLILHELFFCTKKLISEEDSGKDNNQPSNMVELG